jgi:uncharacterized protein YecE (DUF72 family)
MDDSLVHIGTSGWSYSHWAGRFYPADLKNNYWLNYYSKEFNTVEINSSFYHLPKPQTFINWKKNTGADFLFSVKVSRYITHIKRLIDCREALDRLLAAAKELGEKLGPFLFQLPPNLNEDRPRLENFLKILPKEYKFAFEFRNESWFTQDIYNLLKDTGYAVVISSSPRFPYREEITADFCYIRMHGPGNLYCSCYLRDELEKIALLIKKNLKKNIENYVYFNNDAQGYAVENARTLMKMVLKL